MLYYFAELGNSDRYFFAIPIAIATSDSDSDTLFYESSDSDSDGYFSNSDSDFSLFFRYFFAVKNDPNGHLIFARMY